MKYKALEKNKGFTLVEIMVSLGLFSIVVVVAAGAFLKIVDADKKAQSLKTVINNLNFSLESMTREIRMGTSYYCTSSTSNIITDPLSLVAAANVGSDCNSGTVFEFISQDGKIIAYRYNKSDPNNAFIEKAEAPDLGENLGTFYPVTAPPDVHVTTAFFKLEGSKVGDENPSKVFIFVKGYTAPKPKLRSDFTIQTTVSQRSRE